MAGTDESESSSAARGMRAALTGLMVNLLLVAIKLVAGIVGHAYALIADAIESSTDLFGSLVVWGGLHITTRPADEDYPYGYGKAETLATVVVSLMLLGAALGIAVAAVGRDPDAAPSPGPVHAGRPARWSWSSRRPCSGRSSR